VRGVDPAAARGRSARAGPGWLTDYPALLAQWHPTRNSSWDPGTLRGGSQRRGWWRCAAGHEWQTMVASRARRGSGCPMCAGRRASSDRNLAVTHPEVAASWHPSRNGELNPAGVVAGSRRRVWWQCEQGHEWQVTVGNRVRHGCPFCSGNRVTPEISLATVRPELAAQWHPTRNGELTPVAVLPGSGRRVWWQCAVGHEWQTSPASRCRGARCRQCSYAADRRASEPLSVTHPEYAAQWHPTRNDGLTPDRITYGSNRRAWWRCAAGHNWQITVTSRTLGRTGCPYCSGHRASATNNLDVLDPALAAQWHPTRNGDLRPAQVTPNMSGRQVWWQCAAGHEWQARPDQRHGEKQTGCPYCAGRLVQAETSLAAVAPEVAAQWHASRNDDLAPEEVLAASSRRVWWHCPVCGHDWTAAIADRTRGTGCRVCAHPGTVGRPHSRRSRQEGAG